ncbi:NmrA family transcriptional regulator [Actinomadura sp. LD22]|uniref:NmrA family transcriptional regulator n=1 Tax=Actinomadura physcomitrii TaxID=2650748 RepID=A0A6I4MKI6_9ACTN|nr:SDR family oxidoreductase [Actinomadura physcomitrii]MWA04121.1 NmrA family transcriptional regulator [Actinomadura physcomitrii]
MRILVIGGTGLIGSKVVAMLEAQGHEAVPASPKTGVNTITGEGLDAAVAGADVVVDVSNSPSFEDEAVLAFFTTSTGNLLAAEKRADTGHHVALSVVGTERRPDVGYFRAKLAQERLIEESGVPFSLVHATQFFEFAHQIADAATDGGTVRMPSVLFQPIAGEEVARAVADAAVGAPLNGRAEIAGPERFRMDEFFRAALAAWGDAREVVTDQDAPYYGSVMREPDLVPVDGASLGDVTYTAWLAESGG